MNSQAPQPQEGREPSFLETHSLLVHPTHSAAEYCDAQEQHMTDLWDAGVLVGQGGS